MTRLLHLSDLHFGQPFLPSVGKAVLQSAQTLAPDLIIVSGDFTQKATEEEFHSAQAFLQSLPDVPVVVTPGNHDVPQLPRWQHLFTPFQRYRSYIREDLNFEMRHATESGSLVLASLNSTSWMGSWVNGRISQRQLDYCTAVFRDAPAGALRVVVSHHHLAPPPALAGGSVMRKARRTIDHFTDLKIDLILGGHKHRSYIGNSLDFYSGKEREHGIIIVQCGTSTSRRGRAREREKNTFNVIEADEHLIHIDQHMYFKEVGGFEITAKHIYPRAQARYVSSKVGIQSLPPT